MSRVLTISAAQSNIRRRTVGGTLQRILWTIFNALKTQDTFCTVFSPPGIICNVHFHRTYLFASTARYAFAFIAFNSEQRKITHGLQKHCDRAYVFAKCTIVFKGKSQYYTNSIVRYISDDKRPKHDPLHIAGMCKQQHRNKYE